MVNSDESTGTSGHLVAIDEVSYKQMSL